MEYKRRSAGFPLRGDDKAISSTDSIRPLDEKGERYQEYCGQSIHFKSKAEIERDGEKTSYLRYHFRGWGYKSFHGGEIDGKYSLICPKDHRFDDDRQQYPQLSTLQG